MPRVLCLQLSVLILHCSHFIVNNILEGMIWFWVPASLVICNDVFAYIWGITLGRTPLIKLSPKKTVEGFVGAFLSTLVFGVLWGTYFMQFQYMICPVNDLGVSAFDGGNLCDPNPVFLWKDWTMPAPLSMCLSTLVSSILNTHSSVEAHACDSSAILLQQSPMHHISFTCS